MAVVWIIGLFLLSYLQDATGSMYPMLDEAFLGVGWTVVCIVMGVLWTKLPENSDN